MNQFSAPVPDRFDDIRDWFVPLPSQAPVKAWLDAQQDAAMSAVGLSLLGPPGTGKTASACWAAKVMQATHGLSIGYVTSLKYQHAMQERISLEKMAPSGYDTEASESMLERHANIVGWLQWLRTTCQLLVFDDWGKEHTTHTGFIEDEIEYLLRDRFDRGSPTILTSNMGLSSIRSRFGDSMASFIHEAFPPVVLDGSDRRKS